MVVFVYNISDQKLKLYFGRIRHGIDTVFFAAWIVSSLMEIITIQHEREIIIQKLLPSYF